MRLTALTLLAIPLLMTGGAAFACEPSVTVVGDARVNPYDSLAGGYYLEPLVIRVRNSGRSACVGRLRLETLDGLTALVGPNGGTLAYVMVAPRDISDVVLDPLTGQNDSIRVRVPPGRAEEIRPQLYMLAGQRARSGLYSAPIGIELRPAPNEQAENGEGHDWSPVSTRGTVAALVQPSVQANFVATDSVSGSGTAASVSLGNLTTGLRRDLGIQVRANTDVDVSISSRENGVLKRDGNGAASVNYDLIVGGSVFDLSSPATTELSAITNLGGVTNPVSIIVGDTRGAPSGRYSDQITFTISGR